MYDKGGNRVSENIYAYTLSETLGTAQKEIKSEYNYIVWNDRLSKYDGKTVTYDSVGNPTAYDGKTFAWDGKQLKSITAADGSRTEFEYDANGLRVMKKQYDENGRLSYYAEYLWQDGKITAQYITLMAYTIKDGVVTKTTPIGPLPSKIFYDESGTPQGFSFVGESVFTFVRNLQGDVVAVVDSAGNPVVEYSYDPWGNIEYHFVNEEMANDEETAMMFTALCPLTYRGYNYDFTTGLYYLQSRYYNPEWGRFINCDDTNILLATQGETHGANLFAYCSNNPTNKIDPTGYKEYSYGELLETFAVAAVFLKSIDYDSNYLRLVANESEITYFDYDIDRHGLIYARMTSYDKTDKRYYTGRILFGEMDNWEKYLNYDSVRRDAWNKGLWTFIYDGLDEDHDDYSSTTAKIADGLSSLAYLATGAVVWGIGHGVIAVTNSNRTVKKDIKKYDVSNAAGMIAMAPLDKSLTKASAWISVSTNLKPRDYERYVIL